MGARIRPAPGPLRARGLAPIACVVVAGMLLTACATASNPITIFADPGKYEFYNCEQLVGPRKHWTGREQELRLLMERAEQGAGGALVNLLAYRADYVAATEELKLIEIATRAKNCESPAASAAPRGNAVAR